MIDLLSFPFFLKSLVAIFFCMLSGSFIGTYIFSRKMVFLAGGIAHAIFLGIGIGYYFSINPLITAAISGIILAVLIQYLVDINVNVDTAISIIWAGGMACGILFIYLKPGYAPDVKSYLFGNILLVSYKDIFMIGAVTFLTLLIFKLLFKEILYISFDEKFAKTRNLPVNTINYFMMCLTSLTIVIFIKITGVILVISLLTLPQLSASLLSKNFKNIIWLSFILGLTCCLIGLIISYYLNIPSGATIVLTSVSIFVFLKLIKSFSRET